ncbi:MAG: alpha/beta hydrolase [Herminiimonas sp.]|nr:alpha/beta hydrolase [Herminiimonas sp.]
MTNDTAVAPTAYVQLRWRERPLEIEYQWVGVTDPAAPVMVFLHEGLGSLALWKEFPQRLCQGLGLRGLVFSRYGYGGSTPRPLQERFPCDFMQQQAFEVLPQLFAALGVQRPWLFGHSDGGSIALLHASRFSEQLHGIVVLAPHLFVEELSLASIRAVRATYAEDGGGSGWGLRNRLARFHADVDSAFWGWNDVWLDPAFAAFNIEADCARIICPILAIQGRDDEYGTLDQIEAIERLRPRPQTRLAILANCGHSPQRDQPEQVIEEVTRFIMGADAPAAFAAP